MFENVANIFRAVVLHASVAEKWFLSNVMDCVMTLKIPTNAKVVVVSFIQFSEIRRVIVPMGSFHFLTEIAIALHFSLRVLFIAMYHIIYTRIGCVQN